MNLLLSLGLMLITGYTAGWILNKIKLPRIIGYIITGIAFSPSTFSFFNEGLIEVTEPLMDISLAFIAFEVGGALKWSKIKAHKKAIFSISLLASLFPYILIASAVLAYGFLFPGIWPFDSVQLIMMAILLGAIAGPTAPAATIAVIHEYNSRGKVTDTILEVVALDDVLGILIFSISLSVLPFISGQTSEISGSNQLLDALYQISVAILLGIAIAVIIDLIAKYFKLKGEGQWVVVIFSLLVFAVGMARYLNVDELLVYMTIGIVVVNTCNQQEVIFRMMERYTEHLIFLIFFLLSGLHLDVSAIAKAAPLILIFVFFRLSGKFLGAYTGSLLVNAEKPIRKYTAGGLIPEAGIAIGFALSIYQKEGFQEVSDLMLATIMGSTIINEIIGPVIAKYSLKKAGNID